MPFWESCVNLLELQWLSFFSRKKFPTFLRSWKNVQVFFSYTVQIFWAFWQANSVYQSDLRTARACITLTRIIPISFNIQVLRAKKNLSIKNFFFSVACKLLCFFAEWMFAFATINLFYYVLYSCNVNIFKNLFKSIYDTFHHISWKLSFWVLINKLNK